MKSRNLIAGLALSAALIAGVAGAAAAQTDPAPTSAPAAATDTAAKGARKEFVCANQDRIKDLMGQHAALLSSRLDLLGDAKQSATDAGADALVAKIDSRIAKVTKAQEQVGTRQQKLTTWVGENCTG
jgi:flagellin-like hook-associated protein FlgL